MVNKIVYQTIDHMISLRTQLFSGAGGDDKEDSNEEKSSRLWCGEF